MTLAELVAGRGHRPGRAGVTDRGRAPDLAGLRPVVRRPRGPPRGGGFRPGDRVAIQMADGPGVHAAFVA